MHLASGLSGNAKDVTALFYVIWTAISLVLLNFVESSSLGWNWGIAMLSVEALYTILSFHIIPPTKLGALIFMGKPVGNVDSGFVFAPFGFFWVKMETCLLIQLQLPAEPELIQKTDSNILTPGLVWPIRVTHASEETTTIKDEKLSEDPLHKRMTTEWIIAVWLQIKDYCMFLQNVGDIEEARRQIRDVVDGTLKSIAARVTPAQTLHELDNINKKLEDRVCKLIADENWGAQLMHLQVTEVDLGEKVNKGLRDIPAALLSKQAQITKAEADKETALRSGEAIAKNLKILKFAEAKGAEALAKILKTEEGKTAALIQAMREAFEEANYSILPGDSLYSILAGLKNTFDESTTKKTKKVA